MSGQHTPHLNRVVLVLTFTLLANCFSFTATAHAQENAAATTLELVDQTDWVSQNTPFDLTLSVESPRPTSDVDVVVSIRSAITNRGQFRQNLEGSLNPSTLVLEKRSLAEIMTSATTATISLPVTDSSQRKYYIKDPGIYPVQVELRESGASANSLASFVTFLILTPREHQQVVPLGVTTILPVSAPMSTNREQPEALPDHARNVTVLGKVLAAFPSLPIAVAPEAHVIERMEKPLQEDNTALTQFSAAVGQRRVLSAPWITPASGMYLSSMEPLLNESYERAATVLRRNFASVDTETWLSLSHVDATANATLTRRNATRAIVSETDLSGQSLPTTLTRPFKLAVTKNNKQISAGQADKGLASHFAIPGALGAHTMLADLAVLWQDYPGQTRNVIAMPDRRWDVDDIFMTQFLRGLSTTPTLHPTTIDEFFATPAATTGRGPLVQRLANEKTNLPSESLFVQAQRNRSGFQSMTGLGTRPYERITRQLLFATAADLENHERAEWLHEFDRTFHEQLAGIHLPSERFIRLTARRGEIPVSIQNDNGYPIKVQLRLTSSKLDFPSGASRLVTLERAQLTERFAIDARTSGAFPVQVQVLSPDGSLDLVNSRITVRSTATSALGVGLTGGAIAFLLLWWLRSVITTRRAKRHPSYVRPTSTHTQPEGSP